jgi:hypothetical protein
MKLIGVLIVLLTFCGCSANHYAVRCDGALIPINTWKTIPPRALGQK